MLALGVTAEMPYLSPPVVDFASAVAPHAPELRSRPWRRWFGDPGRVFLLVALTTGVYLALVVPHFGGVDETAHFYRSYQLSTGRLLPVHPEGSEFSGACIPDGVVRDVLRDGIVVLEHGQRLEGKRPTTSSAPITLRGIPRCPTDASQRFVTFSTFGSPLPYAPQAVAMAVARSFGAGVDGMVLVSRLAALAAYVALVWLAIRRATRSRWALCAVGLLPVALFQASVSESHDAMTIAIALLVVSSALRLVDVDTDTPSSRVLGEAVLLTIVLAACKPGYIVLAACYWLPLLPRHRRPSWRALAAVPVIGVVVSLLWNAAVGGLWRTDADLFGVAVDPERQRSLLLHEPWTFLGAAARSVGSDAWEWGKGLITLGPSVAVWPAVGVVAALVVLALVSVQRTQREPDSLARSQRVFLVLVFAAGSLLVLGAQYVYWSAPRADQVGGIQARFFVPLLVLVPIAIGPRRGAWACPATSRVPLAAGLVPIEVALLVTITFRMY